MYPLLRLGIELALARRPPPLAARRRPRLAPHLLAVGHRSRGCELNNGRTLTLYDLGRVPLAMRTGLVDARSAPTAGASPSPAPRCATAAGCAPSTASRCARPSSAATPASSTSRQAMYRGGEAVSSALFRSAVTSADGIVADRPGDGGAGRPRAGTGRCPPGSTAWIEAEAKRPWPPEISTRAGRDPRRPAAASSPGCSSTGRTSRSQTLIITFIFAPYFAADGDRRPGARPGALGRRHRRRRRRRRHPRPRPRRRRRPHRRAQALGRSPSRSPTSSAASASGSRSRRWPTRRSCFSPSSSPSSARSSAQVFTNAMLPRLGPRARDRPHLGLRLGARLPRRPRLAGLRPALPRPGAGQRRRRSSASRPILGLDPAAGEPARATGPARRRSGTWSSPCPSSSGPPTSRRGRSRASSAPASPTSPRPSALAARHRSFFAFLVASMVYRDALAALFTFGGIYAAGVLGWGLFQLGVFGIVAAGGRRRRRLARRPRRPRLRAAPGHRRLDLAADRRLRSSRSSPPATSVLGLAVAAGLAAPRHRLHGRGRPPRRRRRRAAGRLAHPPRPPGRGPRRPDPGLRPLRPLRAAPPPSSARRSIAAVTAATGSQRLGRQPGDPAVPPRPRRCYTGSKPTTSSPGTPA